VYARTVRDRELNFAVSGKLWQRSLVMIDEETESLWSHIMGEAMKGPLVGEKLAVVPSLMADWKSWKQTYPDTTVMILPRTTETYRNDLHRDPHGLLIGLVDGTSAKGWDLEGVQHHRFINDVFGTTLVLLLHDPDSGTPIIYERTVDEQPLEFHLDDGHLVDRETKTKWELLSGLAISGPLKGHRLRRLPGIVSDHNPWFAFHPESELVLLEGSARSTEPRGP